jgi:GNAT superfamily N-acetyltransferase
VPGKICRAREIFGRRGLKTEIEADGGIRRETVPLIHAAGADYIVPGSLMFKENPPAMRRWLASLGNNQDSQEPSADARTSYQLRPPQPGDMGWVVHRHGVLYAQEYGWGVGFEAVVAEIVAEFLQDYDPKRERCWIAEHNGAKVGSVLLVKHSDDVAQLRLLLVEPAARGLGIGRRLVKECVDFARQAGYRRIMLWTDNVLHAARHIYQEAGFRLVHEEAHRKFGPELVGQSWEMSLEPAV